MYRLPPTHRLVILLLAVIALGACLPPGSTPPIRVNPEQVTLPVTEDRSSTVTIQPSETPPATATPSATETPTALPSPTPTETTTPTSTPSATNTPTQTPLPVPVVLRGKVLEHANCRYGPGAAFLYKYGVLPETNMDIIGRDPAGTWLLVRAIGGDNPCWLKATLMTVRGDAMTVPQVDPDVILPWSPFYGPLTGVSASRTGDEVTVTWDPLYLKAGDGSEQTPYLVEAWVCQGGSLVFVVAGSYSTGVAISDDAGCTSASHGRVYGAEKHGYTRWVEIPWP